MAPRKSWFPDWTMNGIEKVVIGLAGSSSKVAGTHSAPVLSTTWPVVPRPVKFRMAWLIPPLFGAKHHCVALRSLKVASGIPSSVNCRL